MAVARPAGARAAPAARSARIEGTHVAAIRRSHEHARRLAAEALGTALLLATVDRLRHHGASGWPAATSRWRCSATRCHRRDAGGADHHVRPDLGRAFQSGRDASSFALRRRDCRCAMRAAYVAAQIAGGIVGVLVAHAMFDEPLLQLSTRCAPARRNGCRRWSPPSGSLLTILADAARAIRAPSPSGRALHHRRLLVHRLDLLRQSRRDHRAGAVRHLRRHPAADVLPFIVAQFVGALAAASCARWLSATKAGR